MGIVNLTPDSFSDGGQLTDPHIAMRHCERLIQDGADILDLGAESSRPGARPISAEEEIGRLLPVVRHALSLGVPISVDTYKPEVMQVCLDLGVDIVNDIWALRWASEDAAALTAMDVIAGHPHCGVCLMHMHRSPQDMQKHPMADPVWPQVMDFLQSRAHELVAKGVQRGRIVLDPGVGFGKTVSQNMQLLADQLQLNGLGFGVLIGWSRKSTLAALIDEGRATTACHSLAKHRLAASIAAAIMAIDRGAHVLRVHDVRETVDAIRVWQAVQSHAKGNVVAQ
jgi:dihydropteroate synthase